MSFFFVQAIALYHKNGIEFGPAKAANAGGVAVSGLEMAQNSARLSWSREEVDDKLKGIMKAIFDASKSVRHIFLPTKERGLDTSQVGVPPIVLLIENADMSKRAGA